MECAQLGLALVSDWWIFGESSGTSSLIGYTLYPRSLLLAVLPSTFQLCHSLMSVPNWYLDEAQRRIAMLHEELQSASNKLTTAHIIMSKKCPLWKKKSSKSRRKKKKKGRSEKPRRSDSIRGHLISLQKIYLNRGRGTNFRFNRRE